MSIESRLLAHFGCESPIVACNRLVEDAFPECGESVQARDIFGLADRAGVRVRAERTNRFDGMYVAESSGRGSVTLSTLSARRRQRFTLAHELGHWLLRRIAKVEDKIFRGVSSQSSASVEEERLANLLAAELLMPVKPLRKKLTYSRITMSFVADTAKKFDVSFYAALRRIADIGETPLLFVSVVPNKFRDLTTRAEVDDCWLAWPLQPISRERNTTGLVKDYAFNQIMSSRTCKMGVQGKNWRVVANFEIRFNPRPIPNCDLLTALTSGMFSSSSSTH